MNFVDEARVSLHAGHGGAGCKSFRRAKFLPKGGPDGGDGGKGGDITFVANVQLSTLQDFQYKRRYQAENGKRGQGQLRAGHGGLDLELQVPIGTLIRDAETDEVLMDCQEDGQRWLACKGGRGGKGNHHFASSTRRAPDITQPGEPGEARDVFLELQVLADVGIIGFPNAGKSTLISKISSAKPKIAEYAFTTRTPVLGVVSLDDQRFTAADIPGVLEGAHTGIGLGTRFLKHIRRCKILLHVIDGKLLGDPSDLNTCAENAVTAYRSIRKELELFDPTLLEKPEWVLFNKADLFEKAAQEKILTSFLKILKRKKIPLPEKPIWISTATDTSFQEIISGCWEKLKVFDRQETGQRPGLTQGFDLTSQKETQPLARSISGS